jgi:hypothetical protein
MEFAAGFFSSSGAEQGDFAFKILMHISSSPPQTKDEE